MPAEHWPAGAVTGAQNWAVRSQLGLEDAAPQELMNDSEKEDVFSHRFRDIPQMSALCQFPLCSAPGIHGEITQLQPWRSYTVVEQAAAKQVKTGNVGWGDRVPGK